MSAKRINLTQSTIKIIPLPAKGKRLYINDSQVVGLSMAILPSGYKSFYVIKKIKGKAEWIFLGKYPDLSIENARNKARVILGQIAIGINPNDKLRIDRKEQTFGDLFHEYMERYSKVSIRASAYFYDPMLCLHLLSNI